MTHEAKKEKTEKESQLAVGGGQEVLLPGIPDEVTMQNIAPKLKWKTGKMMQTVSREWQRALRNRKVYEARVLSKYTEPFLVIVSSIVSGPYNRKTATTVLILYSCEDGSSLELPPIPELDAELEAQLAANRFPSCICFGGKIHVWTTADSTLRRGFVRRGFVLNLLGDKKWIQFSQEECPKAELPCGQGILDGKVYHFGAKDYGDSAVLSTGRYEPFFSEWKERQSTDHSNSPVDIFHRNGPQTSQVYFRNEIKDPGRDPYWDFEVDFEEVFLISGEKLLKAVTGIYDEVELCAEECPVAQIEVYDTEKSTWKRWKSFPRHFALPVDSDDACCYMIDDFVAVDNDAWALVWNIDRQTFLCTSPEWLREDNDEPITWIKTAYCLEQNGKTTLRPIFV